VPFLSSNLGDGHFKYLAMRVAFRFSRNRSTFYRLVLLLCIVVPLGLYFLLAYIIPTSPALIPPSLLLSRRPVLVVAHPDDESLFFGPTILGLTRLAEPKELRVLVLSSGISARCTT
jgi:N-acetylglucosaminylphosphatidylinositol deacetylase